MTLRRRLQSERNRAATPGKPNSKWHKSKVGYAFVHTVIDDHSRVASTEVHDDETAVTAVGVLRRAVEGFAGRRVGTGTALRQSLLRQRGKEHRVGALPMGPELYVWAVADLLGADEWSPPVASGTADRSRDAASNGDENAGASPGSLRVRSGSGTYLPSTARNARYLAVATPSSLSGAS